MAGRGDRESRIHSVFDSENAEVRQNSSTATTDAGFCIPLARVAGRFGS